MVKSYRNTCISQEIYILSMSSCAFYYKILLCNQKYISLHYRTKALAIIRKISDGIDPVSEKREYKAQSVTLAEAFEDYLKARKTLKPTTIKDYRRIMFEVFPDWQHKALRDISKDMVAKRHSQFGQQSEARANNGMRILRAVFNFAMGEYEDLLCNDRSIVDQSIRFHYR